MLRIFQRSLSLRPLLPGGVDAHCHLLPGVDDGADSPEESLALIRGQQALGLRGAICTPHIMARLPQNTPSHLRQVFNCFVAELEDKGIATSASRCSSPSESGNTPIYLREQFAQFTSIVNSQSSIVNFQLHLAAEYMLDEAFPRHLASGDLLTIPASELGTSVPKDNTTGNYVLVELPQYLLPPGWQDMLDGILAAGLTPLLAHPERYLRILDESDIRALVARGIALQGNLGSLTGYYGSRVKTLAQSLLDDGLYTTFGTDSHSYGMLKQLKLAA